MANRSHLPQVGVGVVVINPTGEVLLIRRGEEPNKGMWSIPGGKQEAGETLAETAHREVAEETGVTVTDLVLIDVVDLIRRDAEGALERHYALIDYAARYQAGSPTAGGDADAVKWVQVSDISEYVKWSETIRVIREGAAKLDAISAGHKD